MNTIKKNLKTFLEIAVISLPTIVILITLCLGPKTLSTGYQLWRISGDIEYVNEVYKHNWNSKADEAYEQLNAERNALYNADGYVGWFATQHNLIQFILILVFTVAFSFCLISPIIIMILHVRNEALLERLEKLKKAKARK